MIKYDEFNNAIRQRQNFSFFENLINKYPELVNHTFDSFFERSSFPMVIELNDEKVVQLFIDNGFDINSIKSSEHETVLHNAFRIGYQAPPNLKILKSIFNFGFIFPLDNIKFCQTYVLRSFSATAKYCDIDFFKKLMDMGLDFKLIEKASQISLVASAINQGNLDVAHFLLEQGCSYEHLGNINDSPLCSALSNGETEFCHHLLELGANLPTEQFILRTMLSKSEILEPFYDLLVENKPFPSLNNEKDELTDDDLIDLDICDFKDIVNDAIDRQNIKFLTFINEKGANFNKKSKLGPALTYAVKVGAKDVIDLFLSFGFDLNTVNIMGQTALDIALKRTGFKKVCKKLIDAGALTSAQLQGTSSDDIAQKTLVNIIDPGEIWSDELLSRIKNLEICKVKTWNLLIQHCIDNNSKVASTRWLKKSFELIESIGEQEVRTTLLHCFPLIKLNYESKNLQLMKGLIWLGRKFKDEEMARTLRNLILMLFYFNKKLGSATMDTLAQFPENLVLKEVALILAKTKSQEIQYSAQHVLHGIATSRGVSLDELIDLCVFEYDMNEIGTYTSLIGDFEVKISLKNSRTCDITWTSTKTGKQQKSVPASLKSDFEDELKHIKVLKKDIQTASSAHANRIEAFYNRLNPIDLSVWKSQFINHKLIAYISRRLIWRIQLENDYVDGIYHNGDFKNLNDEVIKIPDDGLVTLWHPTMSCAETVLKWRTFLIDKELTQPFKQAHREVYILTDAERASKNVSKRFANHILKHTQFHALALTRQWTQKLGGFWDNGDQNSATKYYPTTGIHVEFKAQGTQEYKGENATYDCVATDGVYFSKDDNRLNLVDLNPLFFSEVMRDIDMFVGVCSIAYDPNWADRNEYWNNLTVGELSQTAIIRKDVLSNIIPKLKNANQMKIEGRFLIVTGKRTTYKIHMGSTNILMAPNDQYLCIVQSKTAPKVMLPFEGDTGLSLILSKAMMLANDDKIKDESILSQIKDCTNEIDNTQE